MYTMTTTTLSPNYKWITNKKTTQQLCRLLLSVRFVSTDDLSLVALVERKEEFPAEQSGQEDHYILL